MGHAGNDTDATFQDKVLARIGCGLFVAFGACLALGELQISKAGQTAESFEGSVKRLEDDDVEVRLAGIYSLERIAKSSEKDHWPVMEILAAYLRKKAPCARRPGESNACLMKKDPIPKPPPDFQAILYVIGRRHVEYEHQDLHQTINLSNTDLRGAFLARAPLQNANFSGSTLEGSELYAANLSGAVFAGWKLAEGLSLSPAVVDRADFRSAVLEGTRFEGVDLSRAENISPDRLEKACLNGETTFPQKHEYDYLKEYIKTERYQQMREKVCPLNDALILSPSEVKPKTYGIGGPRGAFPPDLNRSRSGKERGDAFTPSLDTTAGGDGGQTGPPGPGTPPRRRTPNLDGTTRR